MTELKSWVRDRVWPTKAQIFLSGLLRKYLIVSALGHGPTLSILFDFLHSSISPHLHFPFRVLVMPQLYTRIPFLFCILYPFNCLLFIYTCGCFLCTHVCTPHLSLVPMEARSSCWIPRSYSYRQL